MVAATNRDLATAMKEGRFRADLFYRLSALTLKVPPLRERVEDIAPLAEHFLTLAAQRFGKRFRAISPVASQLLERWRWPGNVRELKAVIERAVLMNDAELLLPDHLPAEMVGTAVDPLPTNAGEPNAHIPTLEEVELRYMRRILELNGGNKLRAAAQLGITRQTLAKRLGEKE